MANDKIEKQIVLRSSLEKVWDAISNSEKFGKWFGVKFDGPFEPGKSIKGMIVPTEVDDEVAKHQKPYEGMSFEITVEAIEAERLFSFRWHPYAVDPDADWSTEPTTLIAFVLASHPDGVELTITESGFDQIPLERRAKAFEMNEQGWGMQCQLIAKYLAR